jgi:diguanylate cyclase (GGDEF)-like protein
MTFAFHTQSFKFRMTVVVSLLVLLASGLVAISSVYTAERQLAQVIGEQQYALLTSAAAYIDEDLGSKKSLLKTISEHIAEDALAAPQLVQSLIEGHDSLRDEFFNVTVFDGGGNLIANLNDRRTIGKLNVSQRPYFQDTMRYKEGVISEPFKSALTGKSVVLVTEPVFDARGKLVYLIGGAIDLQRPRFFGQLEVLKPGKTGYLFMLTTAGLVIQHPDRSRILTQVTKESGGAAAGALEGKEGWRRGITKAGVQSIVTYKRLHTADWIVGSVFPEAEAFVPVITMRRTAGIASALVAAIAGLVGWLAILRLLRPLGALRRHVATILMGSANIKVFDVDRRDEFGELSRAFFALSQQREAAEANLESLAKTDMLTGLNNRRMFDEALEAAIKRAGRTAKPLALAYLDIDKFKTINDTYGHGVGDEVLVEFARRLKQVVRCTDIVARLAGDEFVIIFEQSGGHAELSKMGQKIIDRVRVPFIFAEATLQVTTSVGIALITEKGASAVDILHAADQALYSAKRAGRNSVIVNNYPDERIEQQSSTLS